MRAGGVDALAQALLAAAPEGTPALVIDADPDPAVPFAGISRSAETAACVDFEDEAQRTAAHVLEALCEGRRPVALIAQDRLLVRRVRALLARQDVPIQDETGWKLSTTRAGASVALLLAAARRDATSDDLLDWLKGAAAEWPGLGAVGPAVEALESVLRRSSWSHPAAVDATALGTAAARLWEAADAVLARLRGARPQPLGAWLARLAAALEACGALAFLRSDDAGRQVLEALHVDAALAAPQAFGDEPLSVEDLASWIDAALEEGTYRPAAPPDAPVVITPLERASLRPFAAAVLAGADEKRLGAPPAPWPFLGDALAAELGLPTASAQRERETLAFAQLLRAPRVVLLRRRDDGGEPLAPSPLLERLELARLEAEGTGLPQARDPRLPAAVASHPTERPQPVLAGRLPERLSASAVEALRACPYRFHVLYGLRLRELEELDDEVEKRDYGNWLHDVLHRFHAGREAPDTVETEEARLHAVAAAVRDEMHLDAGAFLPFEATFAAFVPRYVAWLHARDAGGARWREGESKLEAAPDAWRGVTMWGRVDRIDHAPRDADVDVQLLDYKTGSADELKKKAANPLEDTQLAFYAALVGAQDAPGGTLAAGYLTLDERDRISLIEHKGLEGRGIAHSAQALVEGVGAELERIRAGAPLPALGEGQACTWCEARGLCRRDHWVPAPAAGEGDG